MHVATLWKEQTRHYPTKKKKNVQPNYFPSNFLKGKNALKLLSLSFWLFKETKKKQCLPYKVAIFMRFKLWYGVWESFNCISKYVCISCFTCAYQLALQKKANLVTVNLFHMVCSIKRDIIIGNHVMQLCNTRIFFFLSFDKVSDKLIKRQNY